MRLDGFKKDAMGAMVNHWSRHSGDPDQTRHTYRNIRIDASRTHLNYALLCPCAEYTAVCRAIEAAVGRADVRPTPRANVVTSIIVTLPKSWPPDHDPREFFEAASDALAREVGRENVVGGFVHMDETTPHMHFAFVPLVRRGRETNDKSRPLRWTKDDELKNPEHRAGTVKKDKKGTVRYERVPLVGEDGRQVMETVVAQSAMWKRGRMKAYHDTVAEAISREVGFEVRLRLSDDDWVGKLLSDVPQDKMDLAKDAITKQLEEATSEARERAEMAAQEAQEAEIRAAAAKDDLKAVEAAKASAEAALAATQDRLERLRRDEEEAAEEVEFASRELGAVEAGGRSRREYLDAHGAREAALARELEELRGLDKALAGRAAELGAARGRAEGRVAALEVEVEQARARAGLLARLVRTARRRAVEIVRRMREAGRRVVEAMAATVPDHALRADEERRRAVARSAALWEGIDRAMEDIGGDHGVKLSR